MNFNRHTLITYCQHFIDSLKADEVQEEWMPRSILIHQDMITAMSVNCQCTAEEPSGDMEVPCCNNCGRAITKN